ncbi:MULTISPECIES: DUF3093 domain-containing protein [unclassified Pseudactinotalea]|uniref:DUF3093 domain-containing protein n=1 Tax=unclassified Pseudactinotalea TaxID=2649176 RepID=UPI00128D80D6|nr:MULTISPECIES: DUF3093 domain-containing protein [unclassified Pseudactinotalea]MPV49417.1 DUF3093 family protein [Pseudactinotalea sp. HY160]QGH69293.1 DUF3093 family protein [Pseudactinotalea sp. HY158]
MSSPQDTGRTTLIHSERLTPSWLWWLFVPGAAGTMAIVLLPISTRAAIAGAVCVAVLAGAWLWSFATRVEVDERMLRAGRARIERRFVGAVTVLEPAELRALMGPMSDARTHVLHRPWIRLAVQVEIIDPEDPCPSWLISSRDAYALARALSPAAPGR